MDIYGIFEYEDNFDVLAFEEIFDVFVFGEIFGILEFQGSFDTLVAESFRKNSLGGVVDVLSIKTPLIFLV